MLRGDHRLCAIAPARVRPIGRAGARCGFGAWVSAGVGACAAARVIAFWSVLAFCVDTTEVRAEAAIGAVASPGIAAGAAIPAEDPESIAETAMPMLRAGSARAVLRPRARNEAVPHARWAHRSEAALWTRSALAALSDHGRPLVNMVPGDILEWCPAYPLASPDQRAAFWVGFMSALTKHESTYKPHAVGGGGLWYGLLQILPSTARLYKCHARDGAALKNGSANLSCAIRIMARTVPRDGVIHAYTKSTKRRWRGVSADWGPMRSSVKRRDMAGWLKAQTYCQPLSSKRPRARPEGIATTRRS